MKEWRIGVDSDLHENVIEEIGSVGGSIAKKDPQSGIIVAEIPDSVTSWDLLQIEGIESIRNISS